MAFTANKSNGSIVTVVNDYKKEIIAGLALLGDGYVNYSEDIAENFIKLAENFSHNVAPANPLVGQLWYDTSSAIAVLRSFAGTFSGSPRWVNLFAIDTTNNRAGLFYNGVPAFPDLNATANSLVVRGSDGKIPSSSLPSSLTSGSAGSAGRLDPGAKISGVTFTGASDITLTTDNISEGPTNRYFTPDRARNALSVVSNATGQLSYNATTGVLTYNAPVVSGTSGVSTFNGRTGGVTLSGTDVTGALGFTPSAPGHTHGMGDVTGLTAALAAVNAAQLGGQNPAYYLDLANHTGTLPGSAIIGQSNYGVNGYVVFAGGFCVQWGKYRSRIRTEMSIYQSFPLAFTSAPLSITGSTISNVATSAADNMFQVVGEGSTSGFTCYMQSSKSDERYCDGFNWIALGTVGFSSGAGTPSGGGSNDDGAGGSGGGTDGGGGGGGGTRDPGLELPNAN